jgi:hypothetical protein
VIYQLEQHDSAGFENSAGKPHIRFRRRRISGRVIVQDLNALRRVANRSLIKDMTAHDLETLKIETVLERVEEALRQAVTLAKKLVTAPQRRAERIRELRIKKRREKTRSQRREQNRTPEVAVS